MAKRKTNNTYPKLSIIKALYLRAFNNEYRMHPSFRHPQYLYEKAYFFSEDYEYDCIPKKINQFRDLSLLHETEITGESSQPKKRRKGNKWRMEDESYASVGTKLAGMDWELEKGATEGKGDREILEMLAEIEKKAAVVQEKKKTLRGARVEVEEKDVILLAGEEPFRHPGIGLEGLCERVAWEPEKNNSKKGKISKKRKGNWKNH